MRSRGARLVCFFARRGLGPATAARPATAALGDPARQFHSGTRAAPVNAIPEAGKLKTGFFHGQYCTKGSFHGTRPASARDYYDVLGVSKNLSASDIKRAYYGMLVDDIGDVTITNDGATILKMLEVEHPAAKVLVELAELQDREVGDGTTFGVIVAAELLKRANDLLAMREDCKYIDEKLAVKVEKLGKDSLMNCAKTSMSSKLIATDDDDFAKLGLIGVDLWNVCTEGGMSAICAERDYVYHEEFMKAVRKLNEAKKLESTAHYNTDFGKD